jgi:UDPglucose 6-dehydrogenase
MVQSISIVGLGKLGAPMAACFAARGFHVHAVDADAKKIEALNRGIPPVHEPGLAELLRESQGRLKAGQDTEKAVRDS